MTIEKGEMQEEDMPNDQFTKLQMEELKVGARFTSSQYAELILGHLVLNRPIQAKLCYIRAVERIEGATELLRQIWTFGQHIYTKNLVDALETCKNTQLIDQSFQHYVTEIQNRLLARLLELIARTYTSISLKKFIEIMVLNDREASELLVRCMWPVESNFIKPVQNASLYRTLSDLCNLKYGSADSDTSETNANGKIMGHIDLENLATIVKSSVFFDAMETTTNPSAGAGGNPNN
ncbi:hypothetical protein ACQ4LE_005579 [Meloidogyne hapla]|uniref:CSN8_PSD8_EIF3K domain-containing protein n=1 Tax=Meloidogyne hapla TaxID=6305 RepID=A0A1I8BY55_MELHA